VGIVAVVASFCLAACSDGSSPTSSTSSSTTTATVTGPSPSASPSPSLTPEQQAAGEAKRALATYQRTLDLIYQRGGSDADGELRAVAMNGQLEFLIKDTRRAQSNHWRQVGGSKLRNVSVRDVALSSDRSGQVFLDACLDLSGTDTVDARGNSIRKPDTLPAFKQFITLTRARGKRWLVSQEADRPVKSC
jgi:hypothetical protein